MKNKFILISTATLLIAVLIILLTINNYSTKKQPVNKISVVPTKLVTISGISYKNNYYSIKYPDTYNIEKKQYATSKEYPSILSNVELKNKIGNIISITVSENFLHLSLDNALGNGPALSYIKNYIKNKTLHKIVLSNSNAIAVENLSAGQTGPTDDCIIIKGNKIYQIVLSPSDEKSKNEYKSIIQSLYIID
jgi:hypothetical protein